MFWLAGVTRDLYGGFDLAMIVFPVALLSVTLLSVGVVRPRAPDVADTLLADGR